MKAIFIGATGQHVGKTTVCLGLLQALRKRYEKVGFIKPVGQQHVEVEGGVHVDKDVRLFKEFFDLKTPYRNMSPVIVPKGFTKRYLDGEESLEEMKKNISESFQQIASQNDFTIVEGTGHIGVGGIIDLDNATVAKQLGLEAVILTTGGLGNAFDQLAINIAQCEKVGVPVRGVILNQVLPDKLDMIHRYFPKALKKWGIPLVGCIPFQPELRRPTVRDFESLFNTHLISGKKYRYRQFVHTRLVATSVEVYKELVVANQLVITPASREDIIGETLQRHIEEKEKFNIDLKGGMILTGRQPPSSAMIKAMQKVGLPVLYAAIPSYTVMTSIANYTAKILRKDLKKIEKAIGLVEKHVDFNLLCGENTP